VNLSSVNFSRVDLEGENIIDPFLQMSLVCSYYTSIAVQLLEFGLGSELFSEAGNANAGALCKCSM
jgi:hypothetical protein